MFLAWMQILSLGISPYWEVVRTPPFYLESQFTHDKCNKNAEVFSACLLALDKILEKNSLKILPKFYRISRLEYKTIANYSAFQIVQLSHNLTWEESKRVTKILKTLWQWSYPYQSEEKYFVNFPKLIQIIREKVITSKNEAFMTAFALGEFYRLVTDPYLIYYPQKYLEEKKNQKISNHLSLDISLFQKKWIALIQLKKIYPQGICQSFGETLEIVKHNKSIMGIVLDLRGNDGGLFDEALCIAEYFVKKGLALARVEAIDSSKEKYLTQKNWSNPQEFISENKFPIRLPTVVLINGKTASAAELIAGALKYTESAVILGSLSFGKGVQQDVFKSDISEEVVVLRSTGLVKVGNGESFNEKGISPDIESYQNPFPSHEERTFIRQNDLMYKKFDFQTMAFFPNPLRQRDITHLSSCAWMKAFQEHRENPTQDFTMILSKHVLKCMSRK